MFLFFVSLKRIIFYDRYYITLKLNTVNISAVFIVRFVIN